MEGKVNYSSKSIRVKSQTNQNCKVTNEGQLAAINGFSIAQIQKGRGETQVTSGFEEYKGCSIQRGNTLWA